MATKDAGGPVSGSVPRADGKPNTLVKLWKQLHQQGFIPPSLYRSGLKTPTTLVKKPKDV